MLFWLIWTTSTKERHLNLLKTAPTKPNSLGFKWLHWNISFSIHFQTEAINHPYKHNGLCLWQFIIWIMSPGQVCINLCLKLGLQLAGIFPSLCMPEQQLLRTQKVHPGQEDITPFFTLLESEERAGKSQGLPAKCWSGSQPMMECLLWSNRRGNTQSLLLSLCMRVWGTHACSRVHGDQRMTSGVDPEVLPTLISFKEGIIFIFIHANVLPTECLCTIHMPSTNKLLKGMLDLLELQLGMVVSLNLGPLEEHQGLLTTELPLQPPSCFLKQWLALVWNSASRLGCSVSNSSPRGSPVSPLP